jgi:PTH1 family peptidyl-tRNA hydrolase
VELLLVKPTTYMNLSGTAVRAVLARQRAPMRDVLVVVDDFALPLGRLRIRERGSDGGHNGLRSIIGEMGTQSFARLRVGIGQPSQGAVDHVLSVFDADEEAQLELVLGAAADCVLDWARMGPARAADRWNGWKAPTEDEDAPPTSPSRDAMADAAGVKVRDPVPRSPEPAPGPAPGPEPDAAPGPHASPGPDADGILRTRTGWRRLLPGFAGRERPGGRR